MSAQPEQRPSFEATLVCEWCWRCCCCRPRQRWQACLHPGTHPPCLPACIAPRRFPAVAGGVGSGRNFVAGSAELRVPLVSPIEGVLFGDWGSDLDSGASVLGDPAGARGKPGAAAWWWAARGGGVVGGTGGGGVGVVEGMRSPCWLLLE